MPASSRQNSVHGLDPLPEPIENVRQLAVATEATARAAAPAEWEAWRKARAALALAETWLRKAVPAEFAAFEEAEKNRKAAVKDALRGGMSPPAFLAQEQRQRNWTEARDVLREIGPHAFEAWEKTKTAEEVMLNRLKETAGSAVFEAYVAAAARLRAVDPE